MSSEPSHKRSVRRLIKVSTAAMSAALLVGGVQTSSADESYNELAQFPGRGLPDSGAPGEWVTPQQNGLTYLGQAKQWTRTPTLQAVAYNRTAQDFSDPTCRRITQAPGALRFKEYRGEVTLVDRGAALDSPRRYGRTQSFQVRTIAFGSVPVEATVELEQPRNSKGVIIPTTVRQGDAAYCKGQGGFDIPPPDKGWRALPADGKGILRVRIDSVKVDAVELPMKGCVANGAALTLTSRDYLDWDPSIPDALRPIGVTSAAITSEYYAIGAGGLLFGSLDIPAFTGCLTSSGDDLSALLTSTVSGAGNAVQIRTEGLARDAADQTAGEFEVCPFARNCADRVPAADLPTAPPS